MKVLIAYKEGDDEAKHMNTKMTVPKSWRVGPVSKLLDFAVETYNGKHKETPLTVGDVHFEKESGEKLGLEDVLEKVILEKSESLLMKLGASTALGDVAQAAVDEAAAKLAAAEQKKKDEEGKVKCKNFGCNKLFDPLANEDDQGCAHHLGQPFFHDCKKGWSCCKDKVKSATDWDEFNALPTCARGRHSATPPVVAAPAAAKTEAPKPVLKSIDTYNTSDAGQNAATSAKSAASTTSKPKVVKYDDGTYRCQNKGCAVKFDPSRNSPTACEYHVSAPIFHETYKWWSCCPEAKKAEFDDFMAVPGCRRGPHWNGDGEPPAGKASADVPAESPTVGEEVVEVGEDGFDLG